MKCIHCGTDSTYKERSGRVCPKCKRKFAFEPREGDPVTDALFEKAIAKVSGEGKIRWGVEHLYYEVCRRKKSGQASFVAGIIFAVLSLFFFILVFFAEAPFAPVGIFSLITFIATCACIVAVLKRPYVSVDLATFNRLWDRWKAAHGTPESVIQRAPEVTLPREFESDLGDYSFDRAVICDRARTVDLLVANNFHFENNCAILSIDGYPQGPFPIIRKMLKRNPKLQVFVLHDASVAGCQLAHRLVTDPEWFGGAGLRVIDLGLRPRHARPFKGLLLRGAGVPLSVGNGLEANELEWLDKNELALAAIRPEQVLKRLFAGLQAHANDDPRERDTSGQGSEGGMVTYCGSFDAGGSGDSGADSGCDGGADAFG
ncbi:MAG: hypothetical protein V4710_21595 [Verrucomicrobiota bacterium]